MRVPGQHITHTTHTEECCYHACLAVVAAYLGGGADVNSPRLQDGQGCGEVTVGAGQVEASATILDGGREGGREGGSEGGRERGREGRERGREGGRRILKKIGAVVFLPRATHLVRNSGLVRLFSQQPDHLLRVAPPGGHQQLADHGRLRLLGLCLQLLGDNALAPPPLSAALLLGHVGVDWLKPRPL